jgi:hypothetical protein
MGCTSSKPSSSSKSKSKESANLNDTSKQKKNPKKVPNNTSSSTNNATSNNANATSNDKLEKIKNEQIKIDQHLIDQIESNQNRVVDYVVKVVRKDLNAELVKNGAGSNNFVAVIQAAAAAQDNDDLITDIASKAVFLIKTGRCNTSYKNLNDSLKSSHLLCKNQAHKTRICELTTETIHTCLSTLNQNSKIDLVDLLNDFENNKSTESNTKQDTKTPTQKPQQWENAVLLSRAEANEVARMLFYSNRARPVIHASPKAKDSYFVNKQLNENVEITVGRDEIDEILQTFNQPIFNNYQNSQYQYFNDEVTPVVLTKSEPPSSDSRLSSNLNSNNLMDRINQAESEQQEANDKTESLLASLVAVSALTSSLPPPSDQSNQINNDDSTVNLVLENNDNNNENNNENNELGKKDLTDNNNNNLNAEDTLTSNEPLNNDAALNNTESNFEDANTTLNSLNNTNLVNETNSSGLKLNLN